MIINKIKQQEMEVLRKTQPDLYASLKAHFPLLSPEVQGKIAGFVIEYVIQSEGDTDVFLDKDISFGLEEIDV